MVIPRVLRRLSYRWSVARAVRALRLQRLLRKWYYHCARPPNGILRIEVGGVSAQFYVRTPGELRNLDPAGAAQGEQHILERLMSTLRAGGTFYDIGSNVGLYAVLLARTMGHRGQVIAFEPMSQSFDHLQDNLSLNDLTNVRSFRKALGERNGVGILYLGEENADSSLIRPPTGTETDRGYQEVDVVNGDWFVEVENLPLPRAVKIDVEGYEHSVIQGLRHTLAGRGCELVCCEIHPHLLPPEVKPETVIALLKSLGFGHIDVCQRKDTYHAVCSKLEVRTG